MAGSCGDDVTGPLVLKEPLPFSDKDVTFRLLTLNVCCTLASLAIGFSVFHIMQHAQHALRLYEQRYIIRILAVIPIYAWTTFFSYVSISRSVYWELIRECYAAYATVSFFTLMCHYIAPNLHEQKKYLRNAEPKNWGWPLNWVQKLTGGEHKGWLRKPRSGVTWFNINYIGIFQYVVLRTIVTIISAVTQSVGRLCKEKHNPRYASTWTAMFDALSILVAMYCMHQVYAQLKEDLAPSKPVLKMMCVKLIVFLTYWQTWLISLLIRFHVLRETEFVSRSDLYSGIPCLLTCAETLVFAILHYWAFPWRQYDIEQLPKFPEQVYECGPNEALLEAANPWDYCCATARGFRWLVHGVHFRNASLLYEPNCEAEGTTTRVRDGTRSDPINSVPKGVGKQMERKGRKTV